MSSAGASDNLYEFVLRQQQEQHVGLQSVVQICYGETLEVC